MRYLHRPRLIAVATAGVLALGLGNLVIAQLSSDDAIVDESKLSHEERVAKYKALSQAWTERQRKFAEEWTRAGGDPRSLPQYDSGADYVGPPDTLDATIDAAAAVAMLEVERVSFDFDLTGWVYTVVDARVIEAWKGAPGASVRIIQAGGPMVDGEGKPYLATSEADPPLFPGDAAVVFLQPADFPGQPGAYAARPFVGQYRVDGARLVATPGNPFAATFAAQGVDGLREAVISRAAR